MKFLNLQPFLETQNNTKTKEPNGRRILETIKSSRSIIVEPSPNGVMKDRRLNPSKQGNESTSIKTQLIKQAFLRLILNISVKHAIIFSKTAKTVDIAAKLIKTKNNPPQSLPNGILLKIFGNVIKIRLGPLLTSTPKAEQAGKIIKPEVNATNVSKTAT